MKSPANLSRGELIAIVTGVLRVLYGQQHRDGSWTYTADKQWSGGDVCEAAAELLGRFGLVPDAEGVGEVMEPDCGEYDARARRFRQVVQDLLDCCELNLDEMEENTRQASTARAARPPTTRSNPTTPADIAEPV